MMTRPLPATGRLPGRSSSGFTLVELIFCVTIVSMVASMAFPHVMDQVSASRVDNAARVVAGDLRHAFSLASRQGTPVRIEFDAAAMQYRLIDRGSGEVLHFRAMGGDTELPLESASISATPIDVFPNRVASGPLVITLVAGGHSTQVEMSRAAFIRVVYP